MTKGPVIELELHVKLSTRLVHVDEPPALSRTLLSTILPGFETISPSQMEGTIVSRRDDKTYC